MNQTQGIEIRSIEDSLSHAHDATDRAARLASLILDDLNGPSPDACNEALRASGVVNSADYLAGRLEGLCQDIERIRSRIVSGSPKKFAEIGAGQALNTHAGRLG